MPKKPFYAAPIITQDQAGFHEIMGEIQQHRQFAFCKLNHGFWERLAKLERLGIPRNAIHETDGAQIDEMLGISGSQFAEGGMLHDILRFIEHAPPPQTGFHFIPSLTPWFGSDVIEGTPMENVATCQSIIEYFTPHEHIRHNHKVGFTGHEIKVAAITGSVEKLMHVIADRTVIFVGNSNDRAIFDAYTPQNFHFIEVDASHARLNRHDTLATLLDKISAQTEDVYPPLVFTAAGGAFSCWLGFQLWQCNSRIQLIDLGGMPAAYHPPEAKRPNWVRAYKTQIQTTIKEMQPDRKDSWPASSSAYGIRDAALVDIAHDKGVQLPESIAEIPSPEPTDTIPFIENKIYDHTRISELLSLSVAANHHANGGPVSRLLEEAIHHITHIGEAREVVAVSNGTNALHLACSCIEYMAGKKPLRWVASSFNFFSAALGPLKDVTLIDCEADGRFSLNALQDLPLDSFDAVVCTNIFAQYANWEDVQAFCEQHKKWLVIDNATGLLDRPASATRANAPMEIISAHHTKPWGVGEGGFVLCNLEQAEIIRKMTNFGVHLPLDAQAWSSNYKMSDIVAAAIYDRLERMPHWRQFYHWQSRRMKSLMVDAELGIKPLSDGPPPRSPVAHTPFIATTSVEPHSQETGRVVMRKYYKPITSVRQDISAFPQAQRLYAHIFSLPNAPELRLVSNEDIIDQVKSQLIPQKNKERWFSWLKS